MYRDLDRENCRTVSGHMALRCLHWGVLLGAGLFAANLLHRARPASPRCSARFHVVIRSIGYRLLIRDFGGRIKLFARAHSFFS